MLVNWVNIPQKTGRISSIRNGRIHSGKPVSLRKLQSPVCLSGKSENRWTVPPAHDLALAATLGSGVAAGLLIIAQPAFADLNKYESSVRGQFGIGSAKQLGGIELKGESFANMDLRGSNFTSSDVRFSDFTGSKLQGAFMEKSVCFQANFSRADLSDILMDRAVLNEANFEDAVLVRGVFTRSDFGAAKISGADFSDAIVDPEQRKNLCRYADGINSVTGVSTRDSLGCGSSRRRMGSPSNALSSSAPERILDKNGLVDTE